MKYYDFIESNFPEAMTCPELQDYPLWFDEHETIIEEVSTFSVIDDFMSDMEMSDFVVEFSDCFPDYRVFAACDAEIAMDEDPDFVFDSYAEFFLCVDTSKPECPVLIWTGESQFEDFFPSFEEFYDSLIDWPVD